MSGVAVVTGGARGLGWAVCKRLRDDGWQVVAADLVPGETGGDTGIAYRPMDVCDRDQVSSTLAAVVDEHGSLDLLVNNAGITRHVPLVDLTWEDWSAVVDVNLNGVFNCLQAAGRLMIEQGGGVIVNIASVAAERGAAGRAPYAVTKHALVGLTRSAPGTWTRES
jgi:3-oxoacyl-[acyl-carrier protein] reductase